MTDHCGPTVPGHHHHPVEWMREHKHHLAEMIAAELVKQFAYWPDKPERKDDNHD